MLLAENPSAGASDFFKQGIRDKRWLCALPWAVPAPCGGDEEQKRGGGSDIEDFQVLGGLG